MSTTTSCLNSALQSAAIRQASTTASGSSAFTCKIGALQYITSTITCALLSGQAAAAAGATVSDRLKAFVRARVKPVGHARVKPVGRAGVKPVGHAGVKPVGHAGVKAIGHARVSCTYMSYCHLKQRQHQVQLCLTGSRQLCMPGSSQWGVLGSRQLGMPGSVAHT